jgi:hypothetical protein
MAFDLGDEHQDRFLALEVVVEVAKADSGLADDIAYPGLVVAVFQEAGDSGINDLELAWVNGRRLVWQRLTILNLRLT